MPNGQEYNARDMEEALDAVGLYRERDMDEGSGTAYRVEATDGELRAHRFSTELPIRGELRSALNSGAYDALVEAHDRALTEIIINGRGATGPAPLQGRRRDPRERGSGEVLTIPVSMELWGAGFHGLEVRDVADHRMGTRNIQLRTCQGDVRDLVDAVLAFANAVAHAAEGQRALLMEQERADASAERTRHRMDQYGNIDMRGVPMVSSSAVPEGTAVLIDREAVMRRFAEEYPATYRYLPHGPCPFMDGLLPCIRDEGHRGPCAGTDIEDRGARRRQLHSEAMESTVRA